MRLLLLAIAVGLLVGLARGGLLRHLAEADLRGVPLLLAGVMLQFVSLRVRHGLGVAMLVVSLLVLLGFAAWNLHLRGMEFLAVGLALNALVISVNGAMPVTYDALRAAGGTGQELAPTTGGKHRIERRTDRLLLLGDAVGVRPLREVESAGDLGIAIGTAVVLLNLVRPARAIPSHRRAGR